MCGDYFDDEFDDMSIDPDNDFQEDLVDGAYGEEEHDAEDIVNQNDRDNSFDIEDALIFGTIVGGIASDEASAERNRKKLLKEQDEEDKCG